MKASAAGPARPRAALGLWIALAAAIAAIVALHNLGSDAAYAVEWEHLWQWLGAHSEEQVLLAFARLAALALSYWIVVSLLAYTAARLTNVPALIRSVEWMTLPSVRRLVDRTIVVSITVSTLSAGGAGMAVAREAPAPDTDPPPAVRIQQPEASAAGTYVPVPAGDTAILPAPTSEDTATPEGSDAAYVPTPAGPEGTSLPFTPPGAAAEAPPFGFDPGAADAPDPAVRIASLAYDYEVVASDNLWGIAERHLATVLNRAPRDPETATYWAHLIEANRLQLKSGNPDLIYPGERVICPPTSSVGITP